MPRGDRLLPTTPECDEQVSPRRRPPPSAVYDTPQGNDVQPLSGELIGSVSYRMSVVIPVFNEAGTLGEVITRLERLQGAVEIVVVNDGSDDGTASILEAAKRTRPLVVLHHATNCGKGAALRTGFAAARGRVVVVQDADLEYDPLEIERLVSPIERGEADVVYGSRFLHNGRQANGPVHRLANWCLTTLSNLTTGLRLTDMETCQKAFRREVLAGLVLHENGFAIEPEITAQVARTGCRIQEIPVSYTGRSKAAGKKIGLRDGLWTIVCIVRCSLCIW